MYGEGEKILICCIFSLPFGGHNLKNNVVCESQCHGLSYKLFHREPPTQAIGCRTQDVRARVSFNLIRIADLLTKDILLQLINKTVCSSINHSVRLETELCHSPP